MSWSFLVKADIKLNILSAIRSAPIYGSSIPDHKPLGKYEIDSEGDEIHNFELKAGYSFHYYYYQ